MKLYIKASFDSWLPEWFVSDKSLLKVLSDKGINLKELALTTHKMGKGTQYPVHHIKEDRRYGQDFVWIPGVYNDNQYLTDPSDRKYKAIKYIAKKNLPIVETYYINMDEYKKPSKVKYQDPRNDEHGKYAGQYYTEPDEYRKGGWSEGGRVTGRRWNVRRDKSGYVIPNPSDRLLEFYGSEAGAEKLAQKVQQVHDELIELKDVIFNIDFDTFGKDYEGKFDYSSTAYQNIMHTFGNATRDYRLALKSLENAAANRETWGYDRYSTSSAFQELKNIERNIADIYEAIKTERY